MSSGPLRVGVIGCGRIAQEHLTAYKKLADVELAGVADVVDRQAAIVAEQFSCKPYADYRRMLESESIDAVSICTPPVTHAEVMLDAVRRGVHVLCEKPLTTQLSDAKRVLSAVQGTDLILMMASKFRFVSDVLKSKAIIEAGILGKVVFFENAFCSHVDMRNRWNSKKAIAGGGVLFDNATHSVDIVRFLIGPIARVQTQHGIQIQDLEVEDTSRLCFQSDTGVLGTIDVSWSLNKGGDTYISVVGSDGTLTIGWHKSQYRLHDKPDWVVFGDGYSKQEAFLNQAKHFVRCIRRDETPLLTPADGLESVRVIEAAYRSSAINQWSDLEPLDAQVVGV
jgi:predicted dehydrogenase